MTKWTAMETNLWKWPFWTIIDFPWRYPFLNLVIHTQERGLQGWYICVHMIIQVKDWSFFQLLASRKFKLLHSKLTFTTRWPLPWDYDLEIFGFVVLQCNFITNIYSLQVVALFTNNTVGYCTVDTTEKKTSTSGNDLLNHCSHQSDVRTLAFSSDNTALLSASSESVKVWNR